MTIRISLHHRTVASFTSIVRISVPITEHMTIPHLKWCLWLVYQALARTHGSRNTSTAGPLSLLMRSANNCEFLPKKTRDGSSRQPKSTHAHTCVGNNLLSGMRLT